MMTEKQHSMNYHRVSSFAIALGLHILIIAFFMSYKEKNPILTTFDPGKVFPVEFESGEEASVAESSVSTQKKKEVIGSLTGVTSNSLSERGPERVSANGVGEEVGKRGELLESTKGKNSFDKSILYYEAPEYPQLAKDNKWEGRVTVRVKVTPEGIPVEPELLASSGHQILDQAAIKASLKWRFHKRKTADFILLDKTLIFDLNP